MVDAEHAAGQRSTCGISPPVSAESSGARVYRTSSYAWKPFKFVVLTRRLRHPVRIMQRSGTLIVVFKRMLKS